MYSRQGIAWAPLFPIACYWNSLADITVGCVRDFAIRSAILFCVHFSHSYILLFAKKLFRNAENHLSLNFSHFLLLSTEPDKIFI